MFELSDHPLFDTWTDPVSGVTSHLLNSDVGEVLQHFYYTNPSISADGQWLWFTVANPPGPSKHLAALRLDPAHPELHTWPGAQTDQAQAGFDRDGRGVLFGTGNAIWRLEPGQKVEEHWRLPPSWLKGRHLIRLATHCSVASDGCVLIDAELDTHSVIGIADPRDGSWTVIDELQQRHDHGQFCPGNDDRFLVAQD